MIKKYLKPIAYLTIFLLCMNSGLSLAAAYSLDTQRGEGSERILLCTSQGYKWVTIDTFDSGASENILSSNDAFEDGTSDGNKIVTHHDCPFCTFTLYSIDGAIDNTSLSTEFAPYFTLVDRHYFTNVRELAFYPSLYRLSRAPPVFI